MPLNVGNLVATLGMDTKGFSDGVSKAESGIGTMGIGFDHLKTVAIAATAAIAAATVALGAKVTSMAAEYEKAMTEVFTLIPEASEEMYTELEQQTKEFATTYGTSLSEVSSALYQTISSGVAAEDAFGFLEVAQKAAAGGVTDLTTAVDGITSVVNAYGSDVISATEASDLMFSAAKLGKTDFGELSRSLYNVIPTASGLGVEFRDVAAAIAALTAQGTPTSVATTQMRQAFVELSKDGGKAADLFKSLSGVTFTEFIKSGGNTQEALQLLEEHAKSNNLSIMDLFSSVEAGNAALALTGKGTEAFSTALADAESSAGSTEEAFAKMENTFSARLNKIKARLEVVGVSIGEAILPHLNNLMDWLSTDGVTMMQPVLAAFASIGTWWEESGDSILTTIGDAFSWLKGMFQPFVDLYLNFWGAQAQKMTEFWTTDGAVVMQALENIRAFFQIVIEYIAAAWEWLWPYLEGIIGPAVAILLDLVGIFASIFAGDWETLKTSLVNLTLDLMDMLYGIFTLGFDLIMTGFEMFANGVLALLTAAWNLVLGGIEAMINAAVDMLNGLISAMNKVPGVSIPLIGHVSFERAEAPTVTLPRTKDITGGKTPSGNIREALGIEEKEEEELVPEIEETPKEKELADVMDLISKDTKEQKQTLDEFVDGAASPKPQPVEIVAPVPAEEKDRVVASGIVPEAISDIKDILGEISESIREMLRKPLEVSPIYPESEEAVSEEEEIIPELKDSVNASIQRSLGNGSVIGSNDLVSANISNPTINGGDLIIPVMIDGYEVGRAVYNDWNRRTGGGLNI